MNKTIIIPQVVVYQNVFTDEEIKNFYKIISESETDISNYKVTAPEESAINDFHGLQPYLQKENDLIMQWVPWYNFGFRSKLVKSTPDAQKNKYDIDQYNMKEKIIKNLLNIFNEYSESYKDAEWPNFVTSWELSPQFDFSEIELLKHHMKPKQEYAILFHTDRHEHRIEMTGSKQIITFTIYLNDDYEGGEVEFIDEAKNELISYKPRAGDITVFPSGLPFWHAAKSVKAGNNKLFIRVFASWEHTGSEEYLNGVKKYGKVEYDKIMMDKGRETVSSNVVGRQVIRTGENPSILKTKAILINDDKRIYINGKNIYKNKGE